jgi:hypothetical protein
MDIREIVWSVMDWVDLSQNRDQWRAFVNLKVHYCVVAKLFIL